MKSDSRFVKPVLAATALAAVLLVALFAAFAAPQSPADDECGPDWLLTSIERSLAEVPEGAELTGFYAVGLTDADGDPLMVVDKDRKFLENVSGKDAAGKDVAIISDGRWVFEGQGLLLQAGWDSVPGQCTLRFVFDGVTFTEVAAVGEDAPAIGDAEDKDGGLLSDAISAKTGWYVTGVRLQGAIVADATLSWASADLVEDGLWLVDKDMRFTVEADNAYTMVLWDNGIHVANIEARYGEPFSIPSEFMSENPLFIGYATADGDAVVSFDGTVVPGIEGVTDGDGNWASAANVDLYVALAGSGASGGFPWEVVYSANVDGGNATLTGAYKADSLSELYSGDLVLPEYVKPIDNTDSQLYAPAEEGDDDAVAVAGYRFVDDNWNPTLGATSVIVPSSVTSIGESAFDCCESLESVSMPSVTSIGESAFEECTALASVTMPSVTSIGGYAFYECSSLESVSLPMATTVGEYAFYGCSSLESVPMPSVTSIGGYAFYECSSLESVSLPNVTSVGDNAFSGCASLSKVVFGSGPVTVGNGAFPGTGLNGTAVDAGTYYLVDGEWVTGVEFTSEMRGDIFTEAQLGGDIEIPSFVKEGPDGKWVAASAGDEGVLPVSSVGDNVFAGCSNLKSVSMPSVTSVGAGAFSGCSSLFAASFGCDSVSLGAGAFPGDGLSDATVDAGTYYCFNDEWGTEVPFTSEMCDDIFTASQLSGGIQVPQYVKHDGQKWSAASEGDAGAAEVTSISGAAFASCGSVESVSLPSSVTYISGAAFYGCASLKSVGMPSVTDIGDSAFCLCSSLESVELPAAEYVGDSAFSGCTSLSKVTFGIDSVYLDDGAFPGTGLSYTTADAGTYYLVDNKWVDGITITTAMRGDLFTEAQLEGAVEIPSFVKKGSGGKWAAASGEDAGAIPVTSVGDGAFYGCVGIGSVSMPSVTSVGEGAFEGCTSLESASMPLVASVGEAAFNGCSSLLVVSFGCDYVSLDDDAFPGDGFSDTIVNAGTYYLFDGGWGTEVAFTSAMRGDIFTASQLSGGIQVPQYVKHDGQKWSVAAEGDAGAAEVASIGDGAFASCGSMKSVSLPSSVTYVGESAFEECTSLASVTMPSVETIDDRAFAKCETLASVAMPLAKSVGMNAFDSCTSLASVTMPSMESVGKEAFSYCKSLESVTMTSAKSVGMSAFGNCTSLASVTMPSVETIGTKAFYKCASLESVTMTSAKSVGTNAFEGCTSLASASMPSVETIGSNAFYGCASLASVAFPSAVSIGGSAFYDCIHLESLAIPATLTSMGESAFARCSALSSIEVDDSNTVYAAADNVLLTKDLKTLVLFPAGKGGSYTAPDGVESVPSYAFNGCASLVSVSVPNATVVGESAFKDCSLLETVSLPKAESIGNSAFYECTSLASIELPAAKSLGSATFYNCGSLQSVTIPEVTSLPSALFRGCASLNYISMPKVTSIHSNAFLGSDCGSPEGGWVHGGTFEKTGGVWTEIS